MYLCFAQNLIGNFYSVQVAKVAECSGFIVQPASTFVEQSSLDSLFKLYFEFDAVLSSQIIGWYLFTFVSGHALGRIMRTWAKSF